MQLRHIAVGVVYSCSNMNNGFSSHKSPCELMDCLKPRPQNSITRNSELRRPLNEISLDLHIFPEHWGQVRVMSTQRLLGKAHVFVAHELFE